MERATKRRTIGASTLGEFLREAALGFGPRTALLYKPGFRYRRWSYARLWEEAGLVASMLQGKGLNKGDRVLIWAYNCPQWVVAFFGCMRAGIVAVPLDLRSPWDFAQRVAAQTRPRLTFVSRLTPEARDELGLPEVHLEELEEVCQGLSPARDVDVASEDLAEIMFTSGTTSEPKGVMLTHGNLMANMEATSQHIPGRPSDRLLSILPLSHMFEQMGGLLMALRCGANVTYPTSRQPNVLFRTMRERRVTLMALVPQALDLFMKGIEKEVSRQGKERAWNLLLKAARYAPLRLRRLLFRGVHRRMGGSLELVFSGGAALDPDLGARWRLLGVKIVQGYGATEASPVITCHTVRRPRHDSVGLPLPGVEVRIAEEGEILVRGPNVTRGYWEAPDHTAAAFTDGWYKTGDLGFFDDHGFLHIKGRKKDMIVLASGQNVFPEDIEAVLKKHPEVADAVVVGLPKGTDMEVHAVFLMKEPAEAPQAVAWANGLLAEHQQVRGFTVWPEEDFPRTHTLKVKKGVVVDVLRGVQPGVPATAEPSPRPGAGGVRGLRHVVAEIGGLPLEEVTPHKTLGRDLNLDSLKRVELLSALEEELATYVDESQIGPDTTVHQLGELVGQGSGNGKGVKFVSWGMRWWCRPLRGALQRAVIFPLLALTYRLRVRGRENLRGVRGPVLFAANHNLHLDNPLLIKAMPSRWRRRLAIAAAADVWHGSRRSAIINPLLGNGFPFAREGPIRPSLDNLGRVLDQGWSVLIYPEGELTTGGPMRPFKSGVGLIAMEGRLPIIPLRLHIRRMGVPWQFPIVRRGVVEVAFGKPLGFSARTSYLEATQAIEEAVKAL